MPTTVGRVLHVVAARGTVGAVEHVAIAPGPHARTVSCPDPPKVSGVAGQVRRGVGRRCTRRVVNQIRERGLAGHLHVETGRRGRCVRSLRRRIALCPVDPVSNLDIGIPLRTVRAVYISG